MFNIDIEDFFPSINFGRVRGFLIKNRDFQLHDSVATVLAQIACHDNVLPQGSPCSPVFSNLVAHLMDIRLVRLASDSRCYYTRYADDLTFSTNQRSFPPKIATLAAVSDTGTQEWEPGLALRNTIHRSGFRINARKTRQMYRFSRQEVTGLIVNEKTNVRREYRRTVRAMVHSLTTTDEFKIAKAVEKNGRAALVDTNGTLDELRGMLGFINSIENRHTCSNKERESKEGVYRDFLMYSVFHAAETPVVICEGKTDNTYLTHAIRSLAREFPALAEIGKDSDVRIEVRLFRYARSSTGRVLRLYGGGSGVLAQFIARYRTATKKFTNKRRRNPVVVLYDNDKGAKPIKKAVRDTYKVAVQDQSFTHVFGNLYVLGTPGVARIEDYFAERVRAIRLGGKTFKPEEEEDFNTEQHYGKAIFARHVVAARAASIDFSGFRPLLAQLVSAIEDYERFAPSDGLAQSEADR